MTDVWCKLALFGPILLIALGIDILAGRASFGSGLSRLITGCIIVALGLAAISARRPRHRRQVPDGFGVLIVGLPGGQRTISQTYAATHGELQSSDYANAIATGDLYLRPGVGDIEIAPLEEELLSELRVT